MRGEVRAKISITLAKMMLGRSHASKRHQETFVEHIERVKHHPPLETETMYARGRKAHVRLDLA
jgi:hypothetical protein